MSLNPEDLIMEQFLAGISLEGEICRLNHGDDKERLAVDYLCHSIGYNLPDGTNEIDSELRIPVCQECVDALSSNEWLLFYCTGCNASQWLFKPAAKKDYGDINIIALQKCPKCIVVE